MNFNIDEYIKDLIDTGLTKEEACKEAHNEIAKRKKTNLTRIERENDYSNWFKDNCDRYKR